MLDSQILSEAIKSRSQNKGISGVLSQMGAGDNPVSAMAGQGGQQTQSSPLLTELIKKFMAGGAG